MMFYVGFIDILGFKNLVLNAKEEYNGSEIYKWSIALFEEDSEGIVYLDIAMAYMSEELESKLPTRMSVLNELLIDNLSNTTLQKGIRDKYLWVKKEFNEFIYRNRRFEKYKINTNVI